MKTEKLMIGSIPALLWGEDSDRLYIYVHGKMSRKEHAEGFARIAQEKGYQTLSFDLPEHGERANSRERCDVWNGIRDLALVADHAQRRCRELSLYACSLGAYFALSAYTEKKLAKCLFKSPIVDMEWLVRHMMLSGGISEERLEKEKEIPTPIDTLSWDYYRYIISHPVTAWPHDTRILYASLDDLQPESVIRTFAERFGARVTVSPESRHPFMEEADRPIVERWLRENL